MRYQPVWRALRLNLLECLAEGQCLSLGEHIRNENIVMGAERIQRLTECYEVAGDESRPLMDQLVKRMLAIGSGLAPVNRVGIAEDLSSIKRNVFAVTLHCELLEISRESLQVLFVREDRYARCAEEVVVPNSQKPHKDRQVALKRGCTEVLIHLVEAIQHRVKIIRADCDHG